VLARWGLIPQSPHTQSGEWRCSLPFLSFKSACKSCVGFRAHAGQFRGQTIGYSSASAFGRGPTLGRAVARVGTRNLVGDIVGNRGSLHCRERRRDARIPGRTKKPFFTKKPQSSGAARRSLGGSWARRAISRWQVAFLKTNK
jgi:hypothetical protein